MLDDVSYSSGVLEYDTLMASFTSPVWIFERELNRYALLFRSIPRYESFLWLLSLVPLLRIRAHPRDRDVGILIAGALLGAAVILNGQSPVYATHVLPVLVLPLAPLLTHGFTRRGRIPWRQVSAVGIIALGSLAVGQILAVPRALEAVARNRDNPRTSQAAVALVDRVRLTASNGCHVAGDTSLYVPYFTDYPAFTGTRETEVRIGSTYFDLADNLVEYWRRKQPDVVFGELTFGLAAYVQQQGYLAAGDQVWVRPNARSAGCVIRPGGAGPG